MDRPCSLCLLGIPSLTRADATPIRLERKSAALIAYIGLSDEAPRGRLAGLLWPEVGEAVARNNLAQTLRRINVAAGYALIVGRDLLAIEATAVIDTHALFGAATGDELTRIADMRGDLLAGLEFDDCAEFAQWLDGQRERVNVRRSEALEALADRAEKAGQPRVSLGFARRLLNGTPLSEVAHRRVIRLYALTGDRAAATAAFENCRKILWRELGVLPDAATRHLYDEIRASAFSGGTLVGDSINDRIAYVLLRPPRLAGRRQELAQMDAAWAAGKALFLSGEAGLGKTRLMQEFLADKGRYYVFEGLPDDANAPYSTYSRTLRQVMQAFPSLKLPEWVVREAARILPELGGEVGVPVDDNDRLRFHQALSEANELAVRAGMRRVVVDDLHLVDQASLMLGHFVYARHWGRADGMQTLMVLRPDAMAAEGREALTWVVDRGFGVTIELLPLNVEEVADLLAGIELRWREWTAPLHAHSGGNPFFILETLKQLHISGALGRDLPAALPLPATVHALLARRLLALDHDALLLARLAAVSPQGLNVDSAAHAVGRPPAQLLAPWATLESAGILRNGRPACDLWRQALHLDIPDKLIESLSVQLDSAL